ncbi:hypothetical protein EJB05_06868, partial [Eragrostis curvula]
DQVKDADASTNVLQDCRDRELREGHDGRHSRKLESNICVFTSSTDEASKHQLKIGECSI